ncbi:MAG: peptide chain release factor N(5)-glutamine methyltransferase [Pseudomonadota bacterium]
MTETYADLLRAGANQLRAVGISDARHEARTLLRLSTGFDSTELISKDQDAAKPEHKERFQALIDARGTRKPLAHIIGETAFYGLTLKSDRRALIPRADSECVVDLALSLIPEHAAWQLADLGTGSGALLVALLNARGACRGDAIDLSAAAISLAEENFETLGLSARTQAFTGSWSDWTGWATCDLIVSNPPYIVRDILPTLAPEVRDHDPSLALDGGADGLTAYRDILHLAGQMRSGSYLVFEIGYDQKTAVSELMQRMGFEDLQHRQDLGGNDRAIAARKT